MTAVIPMRPDIDPEQRAKELVKDQITKFVARLKTMRKQDRKAREYSLPLPWFAHEGSRELELIIEHFTHRKPKWRDIRVRRAWDCLHLVFVK